MQLLGLLLVCAPVHKKVTALFLFSVEQLMPALAKWTLNT